MNPTSLLAELPDELSGLRSFLAASPGLKRYKKVRLEHSPQPGTVEVTVSRDGSEVVIRYGSASLAARGLGTLMSGLAAQGKTVSETTPFETFGVMLDCSRNAVMRVEHIRDVWLPRLALLGYNMLMLYTEDTYALPGEPYFGYRRGAYTEEELRAIVDAAAGFGIEVVPCIQTLGHLEQILKYPAYSPVRDTRSVLLAGETATYELIEKMIAHWSGICRTRRIHVGMDEAHDLGRGRYMDLHGYRRGFDIFNEHLARVVEICRSYGLKPMIWSDMYFRMGCKSGDYYDPETVIPPNVVRKIPKEADLVYWDYYHSDPAFYLDWIERHRAMGKEPLMASGIWTWAKYWYDYRRTEEFAGPCVRACYEAGLQEVIFTMWGDNGAFCDHDSAFAGMTYCAEIAFGSVNPSTARLEKRFDGVCGGSYAAHRLAGNLHRGVAKDFDPNLWDDPLWETDFRTWAKDDLRKMDKASKGFVQLASELRKHTGDRATGDLLHAFRITDALAKRYCLSTELLTAYRSRDLSRINEVRRGIPAVIAAIRAAANSFRGMWMRHNKPEGMEYIQGRFGATEARYREMQVRLQEFITGKVPVIAELEGRCPP